MIIVTNNEGIGISAYTGSLVMTDGNNLAGIAERLTTPIPKGTPVLFAGTDYGNLATRLSLDGPVFGASAWTDKINTMSDKNADLGVKIGMTLPRCKIAMGDVDHDWVKVSDTVAVERKKGIPLIIQRFMKHGEWVGKFCIIRGRRIGNGEHGADVGCALSTVFETASSALDEQFTRLADIMAVECPEFNGPVTIEAVKEDTSCLYVGIVFGYIFDEEYAKMVMYGYPSVVGTFKPTQGFVSTVRMMDILGQGLDVSTMLEIDRRYIAPIGVMVDDCKIITCEKNAAVCIGMGDDIRQSFDNAYEYVKKINCRSLTHRTDGGNYAVGWYKRATKIGLV
jgi:hypothetical protein